jgi:RNA polymerase sigma factor (sigma-70 family)
MESTSATVPPPGSLPESATDEALLDGVAAGDDRAFAALFGRYGARVLTVAQRLTGDQTVAEDVAQETFLEVWRRPGTYRAQAGQVGTWLLAIARHRAVDRVRADSAQRARVARAARSSLTGEGCADSSDVAADVVARLDTQRRVVLLRRALAGLPCEQREVLERMYWGHQSGSRIAVDMGVPLGTVKTRALLGKRKLRGLVA